MLWNGYKKSELHSLKIKDVLLHLGSACCHAVQNLLSTHLLPEDVTSVNLFLVL
jgi:hypothetical protein